MQKSSHGITEDTDAVVVVVSEERGEISLCFKGSIARVWPLSSHPSLIPRGEAFVRRWGALAVAIGRFFGPLRAAVPLVAGIFAMPYWPFQIANFASAFLWAAVLLKLGDFGAQISFWLWNELPKLWM